MKSEWRTSTVVGICERIRATQDYSACPILADALQDAGCDDEKMLRDLRSSDLSEIGAQRLVAIAWSEEGQAAAEWLFQYAQRLNCYEEPHEAFSLLIEGLLRHDLYAHGSDLHGLSELDDAEELKERAEKYLETRISWELFTFSCSC